MSTIRRVSLWLLALALSIPTPAFALRATGLEENAERENVVVALGRSKTRAAFAQLYPDLANNVEAVQTLIQAMSAWLKVSPAQLHVETWRRAGRFEGSPMWRDGFLLRHIDRMVGKASASDWQIYRIVDPDQRSGGRRGVVAMLPSVVQSGTRQVREDRSSTPVFMDDVGLPGYVYVPPISTGLEEPLQQFTFERFSAEVGNDVDAGWILRYATNAKDVEGATTVLTIPVLEPRVGGLVKTPTIVIYVDNEMQAQAVRGFLPDWQLYKSEIVQFEVRVYAAGVSVPIGERAIGFRPMGLDSYPEMPTLLYHRIADLMGYTKGTLAYSVAMNEALRGKAIPLIGFTAYGSEMHRRYALFARYA